MSNHVTSQSRRIVLFERGFRIFFLAAGIYAIVAMVAWVAWLLLPLVAPDVLLPTSYQLPSLWHGHEMVFGFASVAMAGFLLTAVPNWTGSEPARGIPVVVLTLLWLGGRFALWNGGTLPPPLTAVVDLSFLPGLVVLVSTPIVKARMWRNLVFPLLLIVIWAGQGLAHLELMRLATGTAVIGQRLAIGAMVITITIIGGRVVPAFTESWLRQQGQALGPALSRWQNVLGIGLSLIALFGDVIGKLPPMATLVVGSAAGGAAAMHILRLSRWRTLATLSNPIVWVLHLGYVWLIVGFAAKAVALLTPWLTETTALHAFTAGTIGTMVLGIMSRAALGHSGRPLKIARPIAWAYGLVGMGAALRIIAPLVTSTLTGPLIAAAGLLWASGFVVFVLVYWPILTYPRLDGREG